MRGVRGAVAGIAVAAMTVGVAAPAGAQAEEPEALGFGIDPTEGSPGDEVDGQVNVDDVAEHCTTTVEGLQARFAELRQFSGLGRGSQGPLFDRLFPEGAGFRDIETHEQVAFFVTGAVVGSRANRPEFAEVTLPQTLMMTFADRTTGEPVGERGGFDPGTGEGSVVVPEVDPGFWAVVAACVGPILDLDRLEEGLRQSAAFLEEIGAPPVFPLSDEFVAFMQEFLETDETDGLFLAFREEIAPTLVENIVQPDALGSQDFCVLGAEGACPDGEQPPGERPAEEPPAEGPEPAQPVIAAPTFTG